MIVTARLTLVPATVALARAEIGDRGEFARVLQALVPGNWPPETAADALPLFLSWLEAAPVGNSGRRSRAAASPEWILHKAIVVAASCME